ncbi:hypothetical protein JST97_32195 [bacterium]|nr:hypothetical protein [bacterium]
MKERIEGPVRIEHRVDRVIFQGQSPYQEIFLGENELWGKFLLLDGDFQSATKDLAIYHELLVHPGLLVHTLPRRVLILGGGEGSALREVLRHQCVQEVVMVEQDATLIKLCRDFAPEFHAGAFNDPRCRLIVGDALQYLRDAQGYFDVIIADLTENSESETLDFKELYQLVASRLGLDGIFCTQVGSGNPRQESLFVSHYRKLAKHWSRLCPMVSFVPCYHSLWCFLTASHCFSPDTLCQEQVDRQLLLRRVTGLKAYDGEMHVRSIHKPKHLRRALRYSPDNSDGPW